MERSLKAPVLFLTVLRITNLEEKGIYTDLIRQFRDAGHPVVVVCPEERRYGGKTRLEERDGVNILYVRSLNIQKTNLVEKGLATVSMSWLLLGAIKKYLGNMRFGIVMYSTPPITYNKVIAFLKKKWQPITYLLLKDIFPQNAVDLGVMRKGGFLHRYFRHVEEQLYRLSDRIGCMSEANKQYLLQHNPYLNPNQVEINPNSIDARWLKPHKVPDPEFRSQWNIPKESLVLLYGGNLGKPQAIPFLVHILAQYLNDPRVYFFIVGDGTEFGMLERWFDTNRPQSAKLIKSLPKKDFDKLALNCDVGLIFLDRRFTIPNYPSRLLTYLEYELAVLAATDVHTDIRQTLEDYNLGLWSEEGDVAGFCNHIERLLADRSVVDRMGANGFKLLQEQFLVADAALTVLRHLPAPLETPN